MNNKNPYAPSPATLNARDVSGSSDGVRRDGSWVIVSGGADLPHRCVKCNAAPSEPTRKRTLFWHHPAIYFVILLNILIYIVVALIVRKKVKISPALCARHKARRRNAILLAWLGVGASLALPVAFGNEDSVGAWILFSVLLFAGSAIAGIFRSRILYAKRIDAIEARLGGASEEFLDSLPS
jgi:hypothetical protein